MLLLLSGVDQYVLGPAAAHSPSQWQLHTASLALVASKSFIEQAVIAPVMLREVDGSSHSDSGTPCCCTSHAVRGGLQFTE